MSRLFEPRMTRGFRRTIAGLGVFAFIMLFVFTLAGVAARLFGWQWLSWSFEIAGISFLWVTFLGVVLAELQHENVRFTGLVGVLPPGWQRAISGLAAVVTAAVGLWLAWGAWVVVLRSGMAPTPILRWPSGINMAALATGGMLVALVAVSRLLGSIKRTRL